MQRRLQVNYLVNNKIIFQKLLNFKQCLCFLGLHTFLLLWIKVSHMLKLKGGYCGLEGFMWFKHVKDSDPRIFFSCWADGGEKEGEERDKDQRRSWTNITWNKKNYRITKDTWEEAKCRRISILPSCQTKFSRSPNMKKKKRSFEYPKATKLPKR